MKKGLLFLLALCVSGMVMAQDAAEPQTEDSVKIKGVHPYKLEENAKGIAPEIAHWSIIPHFGFSAFDGDFNTYTKEMKHRVAVPSVGLAVEYNFTPVWNVGIEYMYDMYTVTGDRSLLDASGNRLNADTLLNGHMHKAGAYVSMDVINLFFPRANKKIVSFLPFFGAGGAWYKRSAYYKDDYSSVNPGSGVDPSHQRENTANYVNADGVKGAPDYDKDYRMIGYIQAGATLDFNVNRTIALGIRACYTYFTRDYVDGRGYWKHSEYTAASKNNDGIFDITANIRFKLEAVSKSHPRNMPSFNKFDEWLEDAELAKHQPCHDTIVYYRHDSIIIREVVKQAPHREIFNVYFDNDKYKLRQDALVTIQQVAERLEMSPELYAVIIGYCDNTGANDHNFTLGDNRADIVLDELVQEYAISADRLFGKGSGKLVGRRSKSAYGPNRRASIHLVDEETFELMKLELNSRSEERDPSYTPTFENSKPVKEPNLVPLTESAPQEDIQEYENRPGTRAKSEKGVSLTKLARQNYDNIYCWVYIYFANKDKISNPNSIPEGTELLIPELTEEELQITKEESLSLYGLRHLK